MDGTVSVFDDMVDVLGDHTRWLSAPRIIERRNRSFTTGVPIRF